MIDRPRRSMTATQLVAWYWLHPPQPAKPLQPEVSTPTTQVIPYTHWIKIRCQCCGKHGVSGLWLCQFTNGEQHMLMCAPCAFYDAFAKWTGFYSKKLLKIDLIATLTYPSRTNSNGKDT